jgi:hypothetical protein
MDKLAIYEQDRRQAVTFIAMVSPAVLQARHTQIRRHRHHHDGVLQSGPSSETSQLMMSMMVA